MQACGSAHPVLKPVPGSAQRTRLHVPLSSRRAAVQKRKQENVPLSPRRTAAQKRKQENFPLFPRCAAVQKKKAGKCPAVPKVRRCAKKKAGNPDFSVFPAFSLCFKLRKAAAPRLCAQIQTQLSVHQRQDLPDRLIRLLRSDRMVSRAEGE